MNETECCVCIKNVSYYYVGIRFMKRSLESYHVDGLRTYRTTNISHIERGLLIFPNDKAITMYPHPSL